MICIAMAWMACFDTGKGEKVKTCEKLPDGRTLIRQEICGKDVTLIFAVEQQADVLPHVTELIMAAYAERKSAMDNR